MSPKRATDAEIARLATRQSGVVSRAQLLKLGVDAEQIKHRLAVGRLHPVHRGVYAVGHDALPSAAASLPPCSSPDPKRP